MTALVLDNSVAMRWCFENTSTPYSEEVLEQLLVGHQAHVPVLWLYEVVSAPAKSQRTGVIRADRVHGFLEDLRSLDITVNDESLGHIFGNVYRLAVDYGLSGYDAAYLEFAIRRGCRWLPSMKIYKKPHLRRVSLCFSPFLDFKNRIFGHHQTAVFYRAATAAPVRSNRITSSAIITENRLIPSRFKCIPSLNNSGCSSESKACSSANSTFG